MWSDPFAISGGWKAATISDIPYLFGQGNCIVIKKKSGNSQRILKRDACDNHVCNTFKTSWWAVAASWSSKSGLWRLNLIAECIETINPYIRLYGDKDKKGLNYFASAYKSFF